MTQEGMEVILSKHNGQNGKQGTHIHKNHSGKCKIPIWPQHPHMPANIFHICTNTTNRPGRKFKMNIKLNKK